MSGKSQAAGSSPSSVESLVHPLADAPEPLRRLAARIDTREARCAVLGLGVVGLPRAAGLFAAGFPVLGFDIDETRLAQLAAGENPLAHETGGGIEALLASPRFSATADAERLAEAEVFVLCVPTPLDERREPDLTAVDTAAEAVARVARRGSLVVLESTTYPGTTRERLAPRLAAHGLKVGRDVALAYAPEREDPGHPGRTARAIPRLVAGLDPRSSELARRLYAPLVERVHVVSSPEVAEAAKLLENTYRAVNIALVNELKLALERIGVDVGEVIEAAATKPFGFQRFDPGPGMGGHCIPIDPFYLAWAARRAGASARFVELAGQINREMPEHVVTRTVEALGAHGREVRGARVLVLGLAYKRDVASTFESPALAIVRGLAARGARVRYADPWVPRAPEELAEVLEDPRPVALEPGALRAADAVVLVTDHTAFDLGTVAREAGLVVDARGALREMMRGDPRWFAA